MDPVHEIECIQCLKFITNTSLNILNYTLGHILVTHPHLHQVIAVAAIL